MGTRKDKDEMEDVESISPEQAKKEMREAAKHAREEEGKPSTTSKRGETTSKKHDTAQKDEMADVESIPPEQAKKEIREAAQRVKKEEGKKK